MGDQAENTNLLKIVVINWPNLISLTRLLSAPFIVWLILSNHLIVAFVVCLLAAFSDAVDGFVARMLKSPTIVGAYLDPLADKVLLMSLYFTLGYQAIIMPWLVILIILRDLLIMGGILLLVLLGKDFKVKPLMISKINTLVQVTAVTWTLGELSLGYSSPPFVRSFLFYSVAMTTVLSGAAYVTLWVQYFRDDGTSK